MKRFNTAGPCIPDWHYMIPPEPRLPEAWGLVESGSYFAVHAPRQTGKTTTLKALARRLTEGHYLAVQFSCETGEVAGDEYGAAELQVLDAIRDGAHGSARAAEREYMPPDPWPEAPAGRRILTGLQTWAESCPIPIVLFFDEIDALRGESLKAVLRQLRDGFHTRPRPFPHSVVLCGLRDVRDYKAPSGGEPSRMGTASPFNVKVESLRIGDFTFGQVGELYRQHTFETSQEFTDGAVERAYEYTQGQPWLTNALAREVIEKMEIDPPTPITPDHIDQAKERLVFARATHLDSLVDKLRQPRVRRVVEPLIAGDLPDIDDSYDDDVAYVRDLGLIANRKPTTVANPIYREVIVRVLGSSVEEVIVDDPRDYVGADGRLDLRKLLESFAEFWGENRDILQTATYYHEPAAQLVLMGYLHRLVNGGGYIDREYGIGRGRIDVLIRWPYTSPVGKRLWQREAIELKVWASRRPDPLDKGLVQLDQYLARMGIDHGTLVIFDRRPETTKLTPAFEEMQTPSGRSVTVLRA